jgi:type II secretory pathway pseudopilin PulG
MLSLLAIAATPGFREAQIRQRLARAHADLATLSAGLEAYYVDYGIYPPDGAAPWPGVPSGLAYWYVPYMVTTPIAYVNHIPTDPFSDDQTTPPGPAYQGYRYKCTRSTWGTEYGKPTVSVYFPPLMNYWGEYDLSSDGPDGLYGPSSSLWMPGVYPSLQVPYDPTNGLDSNGDIERGQRVLQYLR